MKQRPIDSNMPLTVTMAAIEWERVLQLLSKGPYDQVAAAIQAISAQCMMGANRGDAPTDNG